MCIYVYIDIYICVCMHIFEYVYINILSGLFTMPACYWGELFSKTTRVVLPERQPGGWSARGQPCDAIHALLRKNMNTYLETCLGYRSGLMSRATETPVLMSNGNVHLAVSHEDSVLSCIYGWQRMAKKQKVLRQGVGNKNRIPLLMWFDLHLYTLYTL